MFTSKRTCISMLVTWIVATAVALPAMAQSTEMEEIVVTARKRDENFQDVPVTINVFTETPGQGRRHPETGRLHPDGAEHDAGGDAERRQRLRRHPRHLAGPQQRAIGCRPGRRRAGDESGRVQPGAVRHPADRGPEGPAGRLVRSKCHRRRDHHHDPGPGRRIRGDRQGRLRQREFDPRPIGRQRTDRRHRRLPRDGQLLRNGRLPRQRIPGRKG